MKYIHSISLIALIITISLSSCQQQIKRGNEIDPSTATEISELDKLIISSALNADQNTLRSIMSEKLLAASESAIESHLGAMRQILNDDKFEIYEQYHIDGATPGVVLTLISDTENEHNHTMQFEAMSEDVFVSILKTKGDVDEFLITNIYGNSGAGWELYITQYGHYSIDGSTAIEHMNLANEALDQQRIFRSRFHMGLAGLCAKPSKQWAYAAQEELETMDLRTKDAFASAITFPYQMSVMGSSQEVFRILPQKTAEIFMLAVQYKSSTPLSDTTNLKLENDSLHVKMLAAFPELKEEEAVFYRVCNQIENVRDEHMDFIQQ